MATAVHPTWEDIIVHRATPAFEPCQEAGPGVGQQFELNRPTCFLLHHDCTRPYLPAADKVADFNPNEVAATKFAVDREVE